MFEQLSVTEMKHALLETLENAPFSDLAAITYDGKYLGFSYDQFRRLYNDAVESMRAYRDLASKYEHDYEEELHRSARLEQCLRELTEE